VPIFITTGHKLSPTYKGIHLGHVAAQPEQPTGGSRHHQANLQVQSTNIPDQQQNVPVWNRNCNENNRRTDLVGMWIFSLLII
jgi:hypothetical protein